MCRNNSKFIFCSGEVICPCITERKLWHDLRIQTGKVFMYSKQLRYLMQKLNGKNNCSQLKNAKSADISAWRILPWPWQYRQADMTGTYPPCQFQLHEHLAACHGNQRQGLKSFSLIHFLGCILATNLCNCTAIYQWKPITAETTQSRKYIQARQYLIMPVNFSLTAFESTHMISAEAILAITFVTCT
jgi:hypothetical protein